MRSIDIVLGELETVPERVVDVSLSGEMHDGVDAFSDEKVVDEIGTSDIALDELEIGGLLRGVEVLEVGAVV